jgi:hypothetical protein
MRRNKNTNLTNRYIRLTEGYICVIVQLMVSAADKPADAVLLCEKNTVLWLISRLISLSEQGSLVPHHVRKEHM